jgi:hypothetical protein
MSVTSIGKADGENVVSLGTQAWNIADGFTKIKILRILIELDLYETVAMFGKKDMEEYVDFQELPYRRVDGFDRMVFSLKQLIGNCKFSIEKGEDEKLVASFMERIDNIGDVRDGIAQEVKNDLTKEVELNINEKHFLKCFNILRSIKNELNFPINRAGLIFRQGEELDLDAFMKSLENGE